MIFPILVYSQTANGQQVQESACSGCGAKVVDWACSGCGAKVVDWALHSMFHDALDQLGL